MSRILSTMLLLVGALISLGCNHHPAAPKPPEISPEESGKQAVELYDTNGDGHLSKEEYEASPALRVAAARMDTNGDSQLTAEEIASRIDFWLNSGTTIMSGNTLVIYRTRPLRGATVTFVPEQFLGPSFKPGSGITNKFGVATMLGQDSNFPGVYVGLYRVEVSKMVNGKETIPSKYNKNTELGVEVADDIYYETGMLRFDL